MKKDSHTSERGDPSSLPPILAFRQQEKGAIQFRENDDTALRACRNAVLPRVLAPKHKASLQQKVHCCNAAERILHGQRAALGSGGRKKSATVGDCAFKN